MNARSSDPLDLDAAMYEASEDRRVGALMRQRNNRETMTRRAEVIEALVAEIEMLRQENEQLRHEDVPRLIAAIQTLRQENAELADLRAKIARVDEQENV